MIERLGIPLDRFSLQWSIPNVTLCQFYPHTSPSPSRLSAVSLLLAYIPSSPDSLCLYHHQLACHVGWLVGARLPPIHVLPCPLYLPPYCLCMPSTTATYSTQSPPPSQSSDSRWGGAEGDDRVREGGRGTRGMDEREREREVKEIGERIK